VIASLEIGLEVDFNTSKVQYINDRIPIFFCYPEILEISQTIYYRVWNFNPSFIYYFFSILVLYRYLNSAKYSLSAILLTLIRVIVVGVKLLRKSTLGDFGTLAFMVLLPISL
jgi:hypothetical protein